MSASKKIYALSWYRPFFDSKNRNLDLMFFLLLTLSCVCPVQSQLQITNSSFEGNRQAGNLPKGWHACEAGSSPDILPGPWFVTTPPHHGESYLGLITRSDGTWEAVGQELTAVIKEKVCYTFSVFLARSETYADYNWPTQLRIWGGSKTCSKEVLLGESPAIDHLEWRRYDFEFFSPVDVKFLIFEGHYAPGIYFFYNGNILLDNCSPIAPCRRA